MGEKNIELKPCPFCGRPAKIKVNSSTLHAEAKCEICNVIMKKNYKGKKGVEDLLIELITNDWNRRSDDGLSVRSPL